MSSTRNPTRNMFISLSIFLSPCNRSNHQFSGYVRINSHAHKYHSSTGGGGGSSSSVCFALVDQ